MRTDVVAAKLPSGASGAARVKTASTWVRPLGSAPLRLVDVRSPQQIVQSADAIPAIAIALDDQPMLAVLAGTAVLLGQEVDQQRALPLVRETNCKTDLMRL